MSWKDILSNSVLVQDLEKKLNPEVIEHHGGLQSTANTDTKQKKINLDVSQQPLKCALSYAYELKNLEKADTYEKINCQASKKTINKKNYITVS